MGENFEEFIGFIIKIPKFVPIVGEYCSLVVGNPYFREIWYYKFVMATVSNFKTLHCLADKESCIESFVQFHSYIFTTLKTLIVLQKHKQKTNRY